MKSFFQAVRQVLNILLAVVIFIFNGLALFFGVVFRSLAFIKNIVSNKLRFSLTFRITVTYLFIFFVLSLLMSTGIIVSFNFFITEYPPEDYLSLLAAILAALQPGRRYRDYPCGFKGQQEHSCSYKGHDGCRSGDFI
ncbi:MAG: hypothetical protein ACOX2P_01610 [Bacillota bacterium]